MKRWLLPLLSASLLPLIPVTPAHADELGDRAAQVKSQLQTQWLPDTAKISTANERAEDAARNLQTLSHAHRLGYSTTDLNLLASAQAHYKLLRDSRRDKTGDGFYMNPQDSKEATKSTLLQGLVVSALVEYARASGESEPRGLAVKTWRLIRDRGRDKINGGYYESFLSGPLGPTQASGSGNKMAQTHLALLQAGTALFELTHDRSIKADLVELLDLNEGRFFPVGDEKGSSLYAPDWQLVKTSTASDASPKFFTPQPSIADYAEAGGTIARAREALGLPVQWVDFSRRVNMIPTPGAITVSQAELLRSRMEGERTLSGLVEFARGDASNRERYAAPIEATLETTSKNKSVDGTALLDFVAAFEK